MKLFFFAFAIFSVIFLDTNLIYLLGLGENRTTVAYIPLTCIIIIEILRKRLQLNKWAIIIVLWGILGILFKISIGQAEVFKRYLTFFIIPFLFTGYLNRITIKEKCILQHVIFLFILVECCMAVYERINLSPLLDTESYQAIQSDITWTFRASALLGHPLGNAMAVSTINIFILCSRIKPKIKFAYFILIMISLICFNERGNIIITFFTSLPIIFQTYKKGNKYLKQKILFLLLPMIIISISILSNSDLGGRLFNINHNQDGSSLARIEAFNVFAYLKTDELLLGNPSNYNYLLEKMNLAGIENGIITILISYGLIIGIPTILFLLSFQIKELNAAAYSKLHKLLILITFYGIGITNPHLSNPYQWFIFICAYYAFRPNKKTYKFKI